jgi:hypothetical protein
MSFQIKNLLSGMAFQNHYIMSNLNAKNLENFAFARKALNCHSADSKPPIQGLITVLGLGFPGLA